MTDNQSISKEKENIQMVSSSLKEEDYFKVDQVTEDEDDEFFAAEEQKDKSELVSVITKIQDTLSIKEDVIVENKPEQEQVGESEENHNEVQVDKETLMASSAPNSPKPKPLTNLQIITEQIRTSIDLPAGQNMADFVTPPTPGAAPSPPLTLGGIDEEVDDLAHHDAAKEHIETEKKSNEQQKKLPTGTIPLSNIDFARVKPNVMRPREQEAYDEDMLKGVQLFFNNKFSEAKAIFETKSKEDPLYALGLSSMAFVKAISSYNLKDVEAALSKLTETYLFANAQIEAASAKKPLKDTVSHYFTNLMGTNSTHLPTNTRPLSKWELQEQQFLPNGALRAHVVKAECALLMAMTYLSLETVVGYLKAGWNLRRAYTSYSLVWQEYKRMGQNFNKYIDQDTVSGIQFGIGAVHLLLSSLPPKVLKIVSAFGWTADKHLGFALLKLCLEGKRIRSPLASLMLLSYYVILTSYAPQILTRELIQPAIECLLDAQEHYPNSAFFLFFAGRVSRLARNLPLSTQSFVYMYEVTQGDWPEVGHLATFEIAFNSAMCLDWASAAVRILELQTKYNSPAFLKYFYGACMEMLGNRTEAILAFAEAPKLIDKKRNSQMEQYISNRVAFFEVSGYQDLDFSLPALEILFVWNAFPCMESSTLEKCLELVESTLELIYEREKMEYDLRRVELVPMTAKPDYNDQRGVLLLMKASILNSLNRYEEGVVHLNWIVDNKDKFKHTNWVAPFAYWECGNTCWGMKDYKRARYLWESTLTYSNYDFEYRLATRLNLAIQHSIDLGVPETIKPKTDKGKTTHGRKRMSIVSTKSTGSITSSS
ncbi:hypothetical protein G6F70_005621 [Rhizopus microsporus]|uniref:Uncharacterized protein n=1 Tax=Rhizopus microsporus TaxID=58291 RepID=A0A1X0RRE6_RHIZD|nr:hypothetical protein G6F71_005431 [Rhizopus microsporus]KAG1198639.1 hypothetical protein G6F70_005621 [Rhizopus microsporus]KAG1210457.1 hypothetical protein G6F69_005455 [Rhizopus microsporus]KAG1232194.1 hypothetical protein G6F67_005190 [Rhizopus microsporus]KAG1264426.1 hypothetical protein G6F68_004350 [Rhizopus microsporus]